jgi:hypothetical protein
MVPRMPARFSKRHGRGPHQGPEPLAAVLLRGSADETGREGAPLPPRAWHDAVGDRIARRTRPMSLQRKVLTVRAATAVWAQELTFLAPKIVKRLVALGFEVESLRFRVGAIDAPLREPKLPPVKAVPASRPLPHALRREIERVGDAALRASIARAATANLAWQTAARGATSARPSARAPQSAGVETDRPDQTPSTPRGAARRRP